MCCQDLFTILVDAVIDGYDSLLFSTEIAKATLEALAVLSSNSEALHADAQVCFLCALPRVEMSDAMHLRYMGLECGSRDASARQ